MHELAIAQSIVDLLEIRAAECNAARVKAVRLKIGEANGIVTDSLVFCFEMLVSLDETLAGARLFIDIVPHRARCSSCERDFAILDFIALCPGCGKWSSEVISGTELQLLDMEIEAAER